MRSLTRFQATRLAFAAAASALFLTTAPTPVLAQVTAFKQAIAENASDDRELARFYRENGFEAIWTGDGPVHAARRQALIAGMRTAATHGLPSARYNADALLALMQAPRNGRDLGALDVELSKAYLRFAREVEYGVLEPTKVVEGIKREVPRRSGAEYLQMLVQGDPMAVVKTLGPKAPEYARLRKEMMRLQQVVTRGGWGATVPNRALEPGDRGDAVVKLRNRLQEMGYLGRSFSTAYDSDMEAAIRQFQSDHGLEQDGVAGSTTLEQINVSAERRLQSILVAMERERWTNFERGQRHIWVNLTDFTAKVMDDGKVTFETRSVVGANKSDRQSPEFSDEMEHMIINPTWHVPRSIAVKEYLPQLKRNPYAVGHLRLVDVRGQTVNRGAVDFSRFNKSNFPFDIKQPPSNSNALGLVKFMFPNRYNIYLHDTPAKSLFARESRAYSHGCIRLHQPFEFAYTLLARQTDDPKGTFHRILNTGQETQVDLEQKIPVHIVYRTAVMPAKGKANYRRDVYGRDARVWQALQSAGVVLDAVRS